MTHTKSLDTIEPHTCTAIPNPATTPSKTTSKKSPSLGVFYQIILGMIGCIEPAICTMYAITGRGDLSGLVLAWGPFMSSIVFILVASNPAQQEQAMKVYCFIWMAYVFGGVGAGQLITDSHGSLVIGFISIVVGATGQFQFFKLFFPIRRKIASFTYNELSNFVYKTVFLQSFPSLPPMLYLAIGSVDCISAKAVGKDVNIFQTCGAQIAPQASICLMLSCFLAIRLFIVPLTTSSISIKQAAEFTGLSPTLKIQLFFFATTAICNTILFALMKDGPLTTTILVLVTVAGSSLSIAVFTEVISIVKHGKRARGASTNETSLVIEAVL